MKINKLPTEYKRGDLIRHKGFIDFSEQGELGMVIGEEEIKEDDYQTGMFQMLKVYLFGNKVTLTLPDTSLCKVGKSGGEWYEVGFGDTEEDYCDNPELLCIE